MATPPRLKACPFCGAGNGLIIANNGDRIGRKFWVVCDEGCLSEGPAGNSEEEAVDGWNRRIPDAQ